MSSAVPGTEELDKYLLNTSGRHSDLYSPGPITWIGKQPQRGNPNQPQAVDHIRGWKTVRSSRPLLSGEPPAHRSHRLPWPITFAYNFPQITTPKKVTFLLAPSPPFLRMLWGHTASGCRGLPVLVYLAWYPGWDARLPTSWLLEVGRVDNFGYFSSVKRATRQVSHSCGCEV